MVLMLGCRICYNPPMKPSIRRVYEAIVEEHLRDNRQMAFGPRQSGKTTLAELFATKYFNWDDVSLGRRLRENRDCAQAGRDREEVRS